MRQRHRIFSSERPFKPMTDPVVARVRRIQAEMAKEAAAFGFSESECDDLRVLVRLTVEFLDSVVSLDFDSLDNRQLRYAGESVFSGVDSFCNVCAAYRVASGRVDSKPEWFIASSVSTLIEIFRSKCHDFSIEKDFRKRCGLLLDLFKLQVIFVGVSYR